MSEHSSSARPPDDGRVNILSSQFFQPSIVDAFVRRALADEQFPIAALQQLVQRAACNVDEDGVNGAGTADKVEQACRTACSRAQEQVLAMAGASSTKKALQDAINALQTHLALPPSQLQPRAEDTRAPLLSSTQHRVTLGFSYLLNQQTFEAATQFDVARQELWTAKKRANGRSRAAAASDNVDQSKSLQEISSLTIVSLWGAELAAGLNGKWQEATKFRQWRQKELSHCSLQDVPS